MLTRQGVVSLVAGFLAIAVGRVFGVLELFIIGSAFIAAVVVAIAFVGMRRPQRLPGVLVRAGDDLRRYRAEPDEDRVERLEIRVGIVGDREMDEVDEMAPKGFDIQGREDGDG